MSKLVSAAVTIPSPLFKFYGQSTRTRANVKYCNARKCVLKIMIYSYRLKKCTLLRQISAVSPLHPCCGQFCFGHVLYQLQIRLINGFVLIMNFPLLSKQRIKIYPLKHFQFAAAGGVVDTEAMGAGVGFGFFKGNLCIGKKLFRINRCKTL